jgi:hypothetical protein
MEIINIESIAAIFNPMLTRSFLAKWNGIETRAKMSASLFRKDFRETTTGEDGEELTRLCNSLREKVHTVFSERVNHFIWNDGRQPSIIPVWFHLKFLRYII